MRSVKPRTTSPSLSALNEPTAPADRTAGSEAVCTTVEFDRVTFRFRDGGSITDVAVLQEVAHPRRGPALSPAGDGVWEGELVRPEVDRFEYRFELVRLGESETIVDPSNPLTAPGAFGERSVIEFPDYRAPEWLRDDPPQGDVVEIDVPSAVLGDVQPTVLWTAAGTTPETPLPLLVALDGVEFASFSGLLRMLDAEVASGLLPPMRAVLCHPTRRDEHYTASPKFARYLARELIPAVEKRVSVAPERRCRVGLGASLGGLALLHAQRRGGMFGGLFCQSSAFFHHEDTLGSAYLRRVERFMDGMLAASSWPDPIPVALTCGTVEENLANNRVCAAALVSQGYPATLHVVRDAHNWIAWRDAWTPHLVEFLGKLWS
jgi:enterochelin esterase-like enzyme